MTDIESLCRLTEAVEAAGADIAPTYLEYVQLSFAIATDCGEAGREFFYRLCRVSPKYQREHAERVFSNALHTQRGEVHLGTAFPGRSDGSRHQLCGDSGDSKDNPSNSHTGTRV